MKEKTHPNKEGKQSCIEFDTHSIIIKLAKQTATTIFLTKIIH